MTHSCPDCTDEGWVQYDEGYYRVLVPLHDTVEHDAGNPLCVCGPRLLFGADGVIFPKQMIVHQAADGRP